MFQKTVIAFASLALSIIASELRAQCPPPVPSNANQVGYWDCLEEWSEKGVHAILLHSGKVLAISSTSFLLYDPQTKTCTGPSGPAPCATTSLTIPAGDLFCSAHIKLVDGRVLFYSGQEQVNPGRTTIYTPDSGAGTWTWFDIPTAGTRFYPTLTLLATGKALLMGGTSPDGPCIFDPPAPQASSWDCLCDAQWCTHSSCSRTPGCESSVSPFGSFSIDTYPFMFNLQSGKVLYAGEETHYPNVTVMTKELLTTGEGTWNEEFVSGPDPIQGSSAVLYGTDRVIKGGGSKADESDHSTNEAYRLDAGAASPAWEQIDSFNHGRTHFHLVSLPNRSVLALGGISHSYTVAVLIPEILKKPDDSQVNSVHPDEVWQEMAPMAHIRHFHSTALLLPDARVLVAGGDPFEGSGDFTDIQIFSPPYLFGPGGSAAAQPQIGEVTSACIANVIYYGGSFSVTTPQASSVTQVNLIRPGSDTHSFDQDQRLVPLEGFTVAGETLTVPAPANGNVAPPGYYMLFIVSNGVPSVARWVHVDGLTAENDCNANGKHDMCDIADGTSEDCDLDTLPDDGPACDALLTPSRPVMSFPACAADGKSGSLPRVVGKNVILLTFSCNLTVPTQGQVLIREMLPGTTNPDVPAYGPNLAVGSNFLFTLEETAPGKPRRLRIKENLATLQNGKWYAVSNKAADGSSLLTSK